MDNKNKDTSPFLSAEDENTSSAPIIDTSERNEPIETVEAPEPMPHKKEISPEHIPVTVITGYLGAGKTTVITNVIKQMPEDYEIAWLKNEMGNTAVDTELSQNLHTSTVKEMLQGCICHVMIGQLSDALDEMIASKPSRIIIETSGSATPAPVVWQIRNHDKLYVDGVVTVVDAENFSGYLDKSPALKMQAKYTDLILINKHEDLEESVLEQKLDDLYEINLDTPKIKTDRGHVSADVIFGLDSRLFLTQDEVNDEESEADTHHYAAEVDLIELKPEGVYDPLAIEEKLKSLPTQDFYRIKGVLLSSENPFIVNCAFGKCTITHLSALSGEPRIVLMGENLAEHIERVAHIFAVSQKDITYTPKKHRHV